MKIKVLKLGTECQDIATQLTGMLTHWVLNLEKTVYYVFQPRGLNEDGLPVGKIFVEGARLKVQDADYEEVAVPFEILGSIVTDKASGFTGMAIEFVRHINGCFHVTIQPAGVVAKTNTPVKKIEIDLRQCKGGKIIELSPEMLKQSKELRPSPTGDDVLRAMPASLSHCR